MKQKSKRKDNGRPKQKGKKIKWGEEGKGQEGRPKLKGKKIKWGRREREGEKGIKTNGVREKKGRKRVGEVRKRKR